MAIMNEVLYVTVEEIAEVRMKQYVSDVVTNG